MKFYGQAHQIPDLDELRDTLRGILEVASSSCPPVTPWSAIASTWSDTPAYHVPKGKPSYRLPRPYTNWRAVHILIANGMTRHDAIIKSRLLT